MDDEYGRVRVDRPGDGVGRVTLARPERRNAQDQQMLYELDAALSAFGDDDDVRVVVVAADGDDFSSGHDLAARWLPSDTERPVTQHGGWEQPGQDGFMAIESEVFFGLCWRWRNFPKPTIVQVQGRVIAGGLMLVWPFDVVVAADDALFSDPVAAFGVNGIEFFAHPWELGARRAKELLFTGDPIGAEEAQAAGMVNRVVPRDELERTTLALAARIAARPAFGVRLAKQSVNQTQDAQGFWTALQGAFALHHVTHAHNQLLHGAGIDPAGIELIRAEARRSRPPA
ncbi:enoyl-CoA hydratase [Conexibacter arvalis]|uniref:Enoyl-CoA hydratase n=1 Tax=Conexibacter arvalis TaxID=912552 RepID=A0A840I7M1_9ACTN|nr:enoyl-CoA hydratase [Conexibacter arvalis]MBB4660512.1 enoyl-CoA hydratase [Conexibacter arvalis]